MWTSGSAAWFAGAFLAGLGHDVWAPFSVAVVILVCLVCPGLRLGVPAPWGYVLVGVEAVVAVAEVAFGFPSGEGGVGGVGGEAWAWVRSLLREAHREGWWFLDASSGAFFTVMCYTHWGDMGGAFQLSNIALRLCLST